MESLIREASRAARRLGRERAFTATIVATLALGVAATSAVFAVVKVVFLEPLPYPDADRIVLLNGEMRRNDVQGWPIGYLDLQALREDQSLLMGPAAENGPRPYNLLSDGEVEHVEGEMVGVDYFAVLGIAPLHGRTFTLQEEAEGASVVILGHDLWLSRFGGESSAVGRTLLLNERSHEVIGVMPPGFRGLSDGAQLFLPVTLAQHIYNPAYTQVRPFRWLQGVARLRPGMTLEQAQAAVDSRMAALEEEFPDSNQAFRIRLKPLEDVAFGSLATPLLLLLGGAGMVLLIACTNLANLILIRVIEYRRVLALQRALGAGPGVVVRERLVEVALIGALGSVTGVGLAWLTLKALGPSVASQLPSYARPSLDLTVAGLASLTAIVLAVGLAALPIVRGSRVAPADVLRGSGRAATGGRGRRLGHGWLVAVETGLALVLLVGATLMIEGFRGFMKLDLGFDPERLMMLRLDLTGERFSTNEAVWALGDELLARARELPGVEAAAIEGPGRPAGGWFAWHVVPSDRPESEPAVLLRHHVTPGYLEAMKIPLVLGRDIESTDRRGTDPVIVVSRAFADRVWPGENPVGKTLLNAADTSLALTVVGVAANANHRGRAEATGPEPDAYLPFFQLVPRAPSFLTVYTRVTSAPEAMAHELVAGLQSVIPSVAFHEVGEVTTVLDAQTGQRRLVLWVMGAFAFLATFLAGVGIYGVVAYSTSKNVREIGIRMALGAGSGQVVKRLVRKGMMPVAWGVGGAAVAAPLLVRLIRSQLFGMSPMSAAPIVLSTLCIIGVALLACLVPSLRALRGDPVTALTSE